MRRPSGWSFRRRDILKDTGAGIVHGLSSVPSGLANGVLAGVSPVTGLYGYMFGTLAGAAATSSVYMSVQGTGAMSAVIADIPLVRTGPGHEAAMATLALLTGLIMLTLGLLRLGSLVRFVPNAVLVGFINAVAINIVLGQFSNFTGYDSSVANKVLGAGDTAAHASSWDLPTVYIAAATIVLIVVLERTPIGAFGLFVGVALSSFLTWAFHFDSVELVGDIADLPRGLPLPILPSLDSVLPLLVPSLSLAFVGLVQGAAISRSIPNPDGEFPNISGDFRGQGVANIVAGLLRGTPVGGSMSATAVLQAGGARTRMGNVIAGLVMILSVIFLAGALSYIAMPALAGLLVLVGVRMVKPHEIAVVFRTGTTQAVVMIVTFLLTLAIPLQYAVLTGVGISIVLFVARQSNKIVVKRWVFDPGTPFPREEAPPTELAENDTVILTIYGSLFFASAPVFEAQLPKITPESGGAIVILRLRGKEDLGSTFMSAMARYSASLAGVGGRLIVSGVGSRLDAQLRATGTMKELGEENVFAATPVVGESLGEAMELATKVHSRHRP